MSFSGTDWFRHHFGFDESVESVRGSLVLTEFPDHTEVLSKVNNKKYNCGNFETRAIPSFDYLMSKERGGGKLHIIKGYGRQSKRFDIVDVLQQQNNDDFDGATFLAASNFNCLEFPHAGCSASHGIANYGFDCTQGPTMATATIGSTLFRNYFIKHSKYVSKTSLAQKNQNEEQNEKEIKEFVGQLEEEINLLENTPIPVVHGKAILDTHTKIDQILGQFNIKDENLYKIGLHKNCEVTTNRLKGFEYIDAKPNKIVHQVYASSFSLGSYVKRLPSTFELMKEILKAEYKLTILAAWENSIEFPERSGSNKCVLVMLGVGSFSNPIDIVAETIAANKETIVASGLEVYVVCFGEDIFNKTFAVLENLVKETKGSVIDTMK